MSLQIFDDRFSSGTASPSLHLNKYVKKGQPGYDPLFKLWPFLDLTLDPLVKNFQEAYHVDESMIGFKGRLSFVQYIPKKPTK